MNDRFLYTLRKAPRSEFSNQVLQKYEGLQSDERKSVSFNRVIASRRLVILAAALFLAFSAILMSVPATRAAVLRGIRNIGGVPFLETDSPPPFEDPFKHPYIKSMMLDEAKTTVPFAFGVPTWAQEGFVLMDDNVTVNLDPSQVVLKWQNESKERIGLSATYYPAGSDPMQVVGSMSMKEVTVNGEPAGLVQGAWNDDQWGADSGLVHLYWKVGDVAYILFSTERVLAIDDMIKMAESIK